MSRNTWYKPIRSYWLNLLESGEKKYEGRINWKDWAKMKKGDLLILTDEGGKSLAFEITNILRACNFDHLYGLLGSWLVPRLESTNKAPENADQVQAEYESIFKTDFEKISHYGVLGLYLKQI